MLRQGLPLFLTLLAVFLAVFFYPRSGELTFSRILPQNIFESVFGLVGKTIPFEAALPFPVPDLNKTVDDTILATLGEELGVPLSQILKPERERLLAEARSELSKALGIKVQGSARIGDILYPYLIGAMEKNFGAYKKYLPALFSFGIFVLARSFFIILGWVSMIFAGLLVKLGLTAGAFVFDRRELTQEYLRLK